MPANTKERLEALEGWVWNKLEFAWESGFQALQSYVQERGDARVLGGFKTSDGFNLGVWVGNQRRQKDSMPAAKKSRLEALNGWIWSAQK